MLLFVPSLSSDKNSAIPVLEGEGVLFEKSEKSWAWQDICSCRLDGRTDCIFCSENHQRQRGVGRQTLQSDWLTIYCKIKNSKNHKKIPPPKCQLVNYFLTIIPYYDNSTCNFYSPYDKLVMVSRMFSFILSICSSMQALQGRHITAQVEGLG